jgi:hypothetical protein
MSEQKSRYENWSLAQLEAEIKRGFGKGRLRVGADPLAQLDQMADRWQRWVRAASEAEVLGKLPANVRQQVLAVGEAVRQLAAELAAARERLRHEKE